MTLESAAIKGRGHLYVEVAKVDSSADQLHRSLFHIIACEAEAGICVAWGTKNRVRRAYYSSKRKWFFHLTHGALKSVIFLKYYFAVYFRADMKHKNFKE